MSYAPEHWERMRSALNEAGVGEHYVVVQRLPASCLNAGTMKNSRR